MRRRLLCAGAAAGVLGLLGAIACQAAAPAPRPSDASALDLLKAAAHTSVARSWTGTHRVVWVRGGLPRLTLVRVTHDPVSGTATEVMSAGQLAVADALDETMLQVLDAHYDLVLRYGGTGTHLVEVRRPGVTGGGSVAGRFWVDDASGMVVRRDVFDAEGTVVRSSVLEGISLQSLPGQAIASRSMPSGARVDDATLRSMVAAGWPVHRSLPGGLDLFEARLNDSDGGEVLQLSYTDGLSTMSLFVQSGELRTEPVGTARPVDEATVWVQSGPPERIVWSSAGHTWTLVSDAPESAVERVLQSLPHTPPEVGDGPAARIWRGMAVVGGWLQPFD